MTEVVVDPGVCGFVAKVKAEMKGDMCLLDVKCGCSHIRDMIEEAKEVDPMTEIGFYGDGPAILRAFAKTCPHPSCPIPSGVLKAVEVEAGLALPKNASIEFAE